MKGVANLGIIGAISLLGGCTKDLRSVAERIASYYIGSPTNISAVYVRWDQGIRWEAELRGVEVASTGNGIPFSPLLAEKVVLTFEGRQLSRIAIAGASIYLARLSRGPSSQKVRNYQSLFPKRGRGRPLSLPIRIEGAVFYFYNESAALELTARIDQAETLLRIDSTHLSLSQTRVALHSLSGCYRGKLYSGLESGVITFTGRYAKATDTWQQTRLALRFPCMNLWYQGEVIRWTALRGVGYVEGDRVLGEAWGLPTAWRNALGDWLSGSVCIESDTIGLHGWGQGRWGAYDGCIDWPHPQKPHFEVGVRMPSLYAVWAKSLDGNLWDAIGYGWYRGWPWRAQAQLHLAHQQGRLTFRLGEIVGFYIGSLHEGRGEIRLDSLRSDYTWHPDLGLRLYVDTLSWTNLRAALQPYQPLLQGNAKALRWQATTPCLKINTDWCAGPLSARAEQDGIALEGRLCQLEWDTCATVKVLLSKGGQTGWFSLRSTDEKLRAYGEWQNDSTDFSISGLVANEYFVQASGYVKAQKAWLRHLQLSAEDESYIEAAGHLTDSLANGSLSGTVQLTEILRWLPIRGVTVQRGLFTAKLCVLEPWQSLLSWDNQAEGWTRLTAVQGKFLRPDLPFSLHEAQVVFNPSTTQLERLRGEVGEIYMGGEAAVRGTLGYLYEDWRQLRGEATLWIRRFRLTDVWREKIDDIYSSRLLLSDKMQLKARIYATQTDILGFSFDSLLIDGRLSDQVVSLDSVRGLYKGGWISGIGLLDAADTSCYTAAFQVAVSQLPVSQILAEGGLLRLPAIQALGLRGDFSGYLQAALRFAPTLTWKDQSTLLARGRVERGHLRTPPFLRWFRPFYIAAYKDSIDFIAEVPSLSIRNGYLNVNGALLLTRIAAFQVDGFHFLDRDQFLYRIQGTRVTRKAQFHPYLESLSPYILERLASSFWLIYAERREGRVRWRYPYKYLLSQFF